eukprot:TRINITY_DN2140_c1_g2_i4.p1 TRINITY_DN2140_c1_g2~~TRINITY_DN2140_c1_g2_i4.p1  ORF type:complete len:229 (+),score=-11.54 TRINITY_DN2140_c1_g2_i4:1-687(+)
MFFFFFYFSFIFLFFFSFFFFFFFQVSKSKDFVTSQHYYLFVKTKPNITKPTNFPPTESNKHTNTDHFITKILYTIHQTRIKHTLPTQLLLIFFLFHLSLYTLKRLILLQYFTIYVGYFKKFLPVCRQQSQPEDNDKLPTLLCNSNFAQKLSKKKQFFVCSISPILLKNQAKMRPNLVFAQKLCKKVAFFQSKHNVHKRQHEQINEIYEVAFLTSSRILENLIERVAI